MKDEGLSEDVLAGYLEDIELHLQQGNAASILDDIKKLSDYTFSSEKLGDKNDGMKHEVVRFLFQQLALPEFITILDNDYVAPHDIFDALESIADTLDAVGLLDLIEMLNWDFPGEYAAPHLLQSLIDSQDEAITMRLQGRIDEIAAAEKENGTPFSNHEKTISTFQHIQWMPDDSGLANTVSILSRRCDPTAIRLKQAYLSALPWGEDRAATASLLGGIADIACEENMHIIEKGLETHSSPSFLRVMLLDALSRHDINAAILTGLGDMQHLEGEEIPAIYAGWLWEMAWEAEQQGLALDADLMSETSSGTTGNALDNIDTSRWSFLIRGSLGVFAGEFLPGQSPGTVSSVADRTFFRLVRRFNAWRLDHMGCMVSLLILLGLGYGLMWVMDLVLQRPGGSLSLADDIALAAWVLVCGGTATTHFSGHETIKEQFVMAMMFWGSLILFLATVFIIRIL